MTQQTSAPNSGGEHSSGKEADATQSSPAPSLAASRQAIILVHGMGEQIPMDTIKGFVKTVWKDRTYRGEPRQGRQRGDQGNNRPGQSSLE